MNATMNATDKRSKRIGIRLTEEELQQLTMRAKGVKLSLSAFIRQRLLLDNV